MNLIIASFSEVKYLNHMDLNDDLAFSNLEQTIKYAIIKLVIR